MLIALAVAKKGKIDDIQKKNYVEPKWLAALRYYCISEYR
jgi:hypothetical protein